MSAGAKAWVALGVGAVGLGLAWVYPPLGVGVTFVSLFLGFAAMTALNDVRARTVISLCGVLHGLAVGYGSGIWLLGVAAAVGPLLVPIRETYYRWLGYALAVVIPFALVVELGLGLAALPYGWWHLALAPTVLALALMTYGMGSGVLDDIKRARGGWAIKVGDEVPDFSLPTRLGRGEFKLSDHRGKHVMLVFLRGDWCPVCQIHMRILAKEAETLAARGIVVAGISTASGTEADEMGMALGANYYLCIDPECTVAKRIGAVIDDTPQPGKSSNLPAMFLVGPDGRLRVASYPLDALSSDPRKLIDLVGAQVATA